MLVSKAPRFVEDREEERSSSMLEGVSESEHITESRNTEPLFQKDERGCFLRRITAGGVGLQGNMVCVEKSSGSELTPGSMAALAECVKKKER